MAYLTWAALVRHGSATSVQGIDVLAQVNAAAVLHVKYTLRAATARIRVPGVELADRADGLWKHTCFEAFVQVAGAPGYYEFNFSPSCRWALYHFDAYREGMSSPDVAAVPQIQVNLAEDRLEVDATVSLSDLHTLADTSRLRLALSAVIEAQDGTISYWALRHPEGKADFHHPDGFTLELPLLPSACREQQK